MSIVTGTVKATTGQEWDPFSEFGMAVGIGGVLGIFGKGGKEFLKYPIRGGGWNSRFGMATKAGALAPFGFEHGAQGFSFMGWRETGAKSFFGAFKGETRKAMFGKMLGSGVMLGFTGYAAYKGYKEGGVWGAAKGVGSEVATWAGWKLGETAVASLTGAKIGAVLWPAAIAAGIGYGGYKVLEAGKDTRKGLRNLELGTPPIDPFGTGFTMRQRSIAAIQKSYTNGRMAMGNEAKLLHNPTLR